MVVPYQAGRSSWEGTSEGTVLRVRIDPVQPRSAEPVRVFLEAVPPVGQVVCSQSFQTAGSGTSTRTGPGTMEVDFIWNRAGRFEFLYQAIIGPCGDHNLYPSMYGWVDVVAGSSSTSQGPQLPTVEALEQRAPSEPCCTGTLRLHARGRDADGYVHRFVIDWGDGAPLEEAGNFAYSFDGGCKESTSGWPARPEAWTNYQQPPTHTYAQPGEYTVTVTAISAGCAGRDEQSVAASMSYRW